MAQKKSKDENLKAIESLLSTLSEEEKHNLFAKFVEASSKSKPQTKRAESSTLLKFKNGEQSLKRSHDASNVQGLDIVSKKVESSTGRLQY